MLKFSTTTVPYHYKYCDIRPISLREKGHLFSSALRHGGSNMAVRDGLFDLTISSANTHSDTPFGRILFIRVFFLNINYIVHFTLIDMKYITHFSH